MMNRAKGFFSTVFHGPQGPVHLIDGSWVDPDSHVPLSTKEQQRLWDEFCREHNIELVKTGTGPDDGYTNVEI